MTERVDLDAVRAQVMTVQTGGNVYVFADDYAALLAERDALETENQRLKMAIAIHGAEACGLLKAYHKGDGTRLATALRAALAQKEGE